MAAGYLGSTLTGLLLLLLLLLVEVTVLLLVVLLLQCGVRATGSVGV